MKRILALLTILTLCLTGCAAVSGSGKNVTFYYLRREYTYGSADSVIVPELRNVSAAVEDIPYLLHLYLSGPQSDGLYLPLPAGTRLMGMEEDGSTCKLTFSEEFSYLEGLPLTLSCACISATVFSLTEAETLEIQSPAPEGGSPVKVTLTRSSILTYDHITTPADAS